MPKITKRATLYCEFCPRTFGEVGEPGSLKRSDQNSHFDPICPHSRAGMVTKGTEEHFSAYTTAL